MRKDEFGNNECSSSAKNPNIDEKEIKEYFETECKDKKECNFNVDPSGNQFIKNIGKPNADPKIQ